MKMLGNLYNKIWFYTEFWLTPVDRRPFTFCMRDFIFGHPAWAWPMIIAWYISMGFLVYYYVWAGWAITIASTAVLFHVIWGSKWIEGQQEFPEYLGD